MKNRLIAFLETHKILVHCQFRQEQNPSSYMDLMSLMDKFIVSLENNNNNNKIVSVYVWISKDFDSINHNIMHM